MNYLMLQLFQRLSPDMIDDDGFFDLLSKFQSRRMDEQRCSLRVLSTNENGLTEKQLTPKSNKKASKLKVKESTAGMNLLYYHR